MSTTTLPGISGTLMPARFLADPGAWRHVAAAPATLDQRRRRLVRWWSDVERRCGPATGSRALFDVAAEPLVRLLGYRAVASTFDGARAAARLDTPGGAPVALLLLPWADRPSSVWRDAVLTARDHGSGWCLVVAPPLLSLVDARGHASRRAIDFLLPDALSAGSIDRLLAVLASSTFAGGEPRIDALVASGARFQDRVRSDLQHGVLQALRELPPSIASAGGPLAEKRRTFDEALTVVYRILFLLFAESRHLVPATHPLYARAYAVGTLCRDALAGRDDGLWEAMAAVTRLSRAGCRTDDLIVRPFNGRLFARASAPSLEQRTGRGRARATGRERGRAMTRTLIALGSRPGAGGRETIHYGDLGVEQLGAVYERVLDLDPGRRKQTGTFYTPQPLAEFVVRRTLAPLVAGRSSDGILALRVVDPSMGSGAFLVAACRFLADAYEQAMVDEGRLARSDLDGESRASMRRLVAERCLSGVDVNPVAVQVARLSLWLASLARGKPLGFLDHQLRTGNSLIGASPDDLHREPGRRGGRGTTLPLFVDDRLASTLRSIAMPWRSLRLQPDDTVSDVRQKEQLWRRMTGTMSPLESWRTAASLWCARWFWNETGGPAPSGAELRAAIDAVLRGEAQLPTRQLAAWTARARALASEYGFFHWPLEFADVFYDASGAPREAPGFDAVIGNPPWEMVRRDAGPHVDGTPQPASLLGFVRGSGLYPGCDRGHLNLYQPFVDRAIALTRPGGRIGLVLPWGVATDDGAATLRQRLFDQTAIDTMVGLDNTRGLFPIHRGLRFLVFTAGRTGRTTTIRARLGVRTAAELDHLPGRDATAEGRDGAFPLRLGRALIERVGGPGLRVPDARSPGDLALLDHVFRACPPAGDPAGWGLRFGRELNATEDKTCFGAVGLPVLDGRHITPFVAHPARSTRRIPADDAARRLPDRRYERPRLAYRDVSGVGNRQCLIAAIVPGGTVTTHTLFCLRSPIPIERQHFLCAVFNSRLIDRVVRMLMGGHVTTGLVESLPVPPWRDEAVERRIAELAGRLPGAADAESIRAELEVRIAELYGLPAEASARASAL